MRLRLTGFVLLLAMLTALSGCKKKEKSVPPPQAQAPTLPLPQIELPPAPSPLPPAEAQPQPQPEINQTPSTAAKHPKKKSKPKANVAKTPPPADKTPPPAEKKPSTVVKEGGTGTSGNEQLSASLPAAAEEHKRQSTQQLQQATEGNLRALNRTLSDDEQAMVQQIRAYLQQSHNAEADGDVQRAYNLALKANLLSKDLIKR